MSSAGADTQIAGTAAASTTEAPGSLAKGANNNDTAEVAADGRVPVHGVTGPHSDYVVLVSSDFHEFIISRRAAYISATIRRMLEGRNKDVNPWNVNEVLVNYPSAIVSKIAEYLIYKEYYERTQEEAPGCSVQPGIVLEVLMAAQFLDI